MQYVVNEWIWLGYKDLDESLRKNKSLRREGGSKFTNGKTLTGLKNGDLHALVLRRPTPSRALNIDRIGPGRSATVGGCSAAARSTGGLQHEDSRDQAQNPGHQPTASLATGADTQSGKAQTSDGQPGGIERTAVEQAARGYWSRHGLDRQSRAAASRPRKSDGGGIEGGSACGDH